ncbi:GNAT family N-acetyltransferase [Nocardioides sp. zg-1228]|uniref:GNAT family N-acetyltransferase n=1 Tax=Nocardioides sp. zg-1228 TaxID=2763008 RepID=UPI00164303B6|nr:GNAT family N-acetyltransferase [Nocardioides sp. zg-1228]MBC2934058.1 GNAT family N-acetyltransferase [Nocardioides sp. zg-1228]QSF58811.1 GNAT family N-acetyltransferase [Nocardioides sp. zg-1228]
MSIVVRPSEDAGKYLATDQLVWFGEVTDDDAEHLRLGLPEDQRFVVDLPDGPDDLHSGIYGVRPMSMSLPGGSVVPVAGLTWVGVHPDARRRGVLAAMIRDHLDRTRAAGTAISVLHASEAAIYGRFGYGNAVLTHQVDLGRGTTFTAPHLEDEVAGVTTHLHDMAAPGIAERMRACQLASAPHFPGTVVGSPDYVSLLGHEAPEQLRDKEPRRVLIARRAGADVGFVGLRRQHKWDNARPAGTVVVGTFFGDPAARLALARRVVELDLMGTSRLESIGLDDPLLAWIGGHRSTGDLKTWDSTWVRLVDLEAAWALRSYEADCDVVVEVADRHVPGNAGRWRLTASAGRGTASPAGSPAGTPADVTLDIGVLGAGYLGHGIGALLRAGLVAEHRAGAYAELARAMRTLVAPEPSIGF